MRSVRQRSLKIRTICFRLMRRGSVVSVNFVGFVSPSSHSATSQSGSWSARVSPSSCVVFTRTKQKCEISFAFEP